MVSHAPWTTYLQFEQVNPVIVIFKYARDISEEKINWWNNLVLQYVQVVRWLLNVAKLEPDHLHQLQNTAQHP